MSQYCRHTILRHPGGRLNETEGRAQGPSSPHSASRRAELTAFRLIDGAVAEVHRSVVGPRIHAGIVAAVSPVVLASRTLVVADHAVAP